MPVPSPRNSIRIARGNYADLAVNITEIGDGELCFAIDQDRFYSKGGGQLIPVGSGTELASISQLGDVDVAGLASGQILVYDGTNWIPGDAPSGDVDSVNGQTGIVVIDLGDLPSVDLSTTPPEAGQVLGYNGSAWVPTENTGAGSTINSTRYFYVSDTNLNAVGASQVRLDNADLTLATEIAFSNVDRNGVDISAILQNMVDESYGVYLQQQDDPGRAVLFHFTGGCSNVGDVVKSRFPVEYVSDTGSALQTTKDCYVVFSTQATANSVTSVNGQQGAVVLTAADVGAATAAQGALAATALQPTDSIDALADVDTASPGHVPTDGQYLQWNQSMGHWMPGTVEAGGSTVTISETPPSSPSQGDQWWDSSADSGRMYVYYEDGGSNQWVEASPAAAAPTPNLQAVTAVGNTATTGAEFGGTVIGNEVDLDALGRAWDMKTDGNFATTSGGGGGLVISNPANATPGTSGLIRLTGSPSGWGDAWKHPGGAAQSIANFPAVVPFYVESSSVILLGKATQGIA